ncbi:MAG: type II secretion system protein GspL [Sphingobium sp.]
MSGVDGLIVILPSRGESEPRWLKAVDGEIVARSETAARAGEGSHIVLLAVPPASATIRRVELPGAMPPAQARVVAARLACEASMADAADLHAVPFAQPADETGLLRDVAVIARADMAHFIAWARHHDLEPDIVLPVTSVLPVPDEGYAAAEIGDMRIVRGVGFAADASEGWVSQVIAEMPLAVLDSAQTEASLLAALDAPPVNLRSGEFAPRRAALFSSQLVRRLAVWGGFIALATLLISLVLMAKLHWSAASLDRQTVELARPLLPAANDATLVSEEIDRMVAQKGGGGYIFTGPAAGLMTAMQGTPAVSLSSLGLDDSGLLHATLASARADDINAVLLAVQAAGYRITATSSVDPGGRVIAEITVRP